MKNPILNNFLSIREYRTLYNAFLNFPTEENKIKLEKAFQLYFLKIRLLQYLSKSIHFAAQNFDKKHRKIKEHNQLILDKPLNEDGETLLNNLNSESYYKNFDEEVIRDYQNIESYFTDQIISEAVSKLTSRQKQILYLSFVKIYSDQEVAELLHVSKQAINKQKNKAIEKIRGAING